MRAIFLIALLLSAPLAAQTSTPGVPGTARHYLERMDADHDGRVSLAEYQDWMGYAFAAMDRDGDGVLSAAELPGGRGKPVSREAHLQRLAGGFRRQDRDGDGWLSAAELVAPPR